MNVIRSAIAGLLALVALVVGGLTVMPAGLLAAVPMIAYTDRDWEFAVYIQNADGTVVDITGTTWSFKLYATPGATPSVTDVPTIASAAGGQLSVVITAAEMTMTAGQYTAELYRTSAGADVYGTWPVTVGAPGAVIGASGSVTVKVAQINLNTGPRNLVMKAVNAPVSVSSSGSLADGDYGDVVVSGSNTVWTLDAVDSRADEECLTWESSSSKFEWQTCGSGGSLSDADYGDITVSGSGTVLTVDPDSVALGTDTTGGYAASATEGGSATSVAADSVALTTGTTGNYVASLVAGTAIDVGAAAEGGTPTIDVDLTELSTATLGAGAFTTLTFDAGASDPVLTAASGTLTVSTGNLLVTTAGTASTSVTTIDGTQTLTNKSIVATQITAGALNIGNNAATIGTLELANGTANTLSASGGALSIEGVVVLTTATGQPLDADLTSWAAITRASGYDTFATTPTSANLAALITNEVGTGLAVFNDGPTFVTSIAPTSNDGAALGTTTLRWADLFGADGAVINLGTTSSRATITHTAASDSIVIAADPDNATATSQVVMSIDGTNELILDPTSLTPGADGGNSLGTTALGWQNLFANTGFVLNIENSDWVATHTTGILTVGTGDLRVTTAGTNTASVVTVGGTQTLTGKSIVATQITAGALNIGNNAATVGTLELANGTANTLSASGGVLSIEGVAIVSASTSAGGDLTGTYPNPTIAADKVTEASLKAVDAPADEECLTYESSVGDFEWQSCGGGGSLTDGDKGDITVSSSGAVWDIDGDAVITSTAAGATGILLNFQNDSASPAANDIPVELTFTGRDSAANAQEYAQIQVQIDDPVSTSEDSTLFLGVVTAGTVANKVALTDSSFNPAASDGTALGTTALQWSDLFLASGAVLNIANGDWVATHTSGILTVGTGDLRVTTAGTNSASAVTVGGTQTLTGKSIVATQITAGALNIGNNAATVGTIELANGTANTLSAAAGVLSIEGVALVPTTITITGGVGIAAMGDLSANRTVTLDLTEVSSAVWGAGAFTTETFSGAGAIDMTWNYATSNTAILTQTDAGAAGPIIDVFADSASPAASDVPAQSLFTGRDSAANKQTYAQETVTITDPVSTSEDATIKWGVATAGTVADEMVLDGASLSPVTSDGSALGTGSLMWADLFLASGSVLNWNNGDCTLTHAADLLTTGGNCQVAVVQTGDLTSALSVEGTGAGNGVGIRVYASSASPAAGDELGFLLFRGKDSGANDANYASQSGFIIDTTDTSEDGGYAMFSMVAGTFAAKAFLYQGLGMASDAPLGFNNDTSPQTSPSLDATLCRSGAGIIQVGTTACNSSGTLATSTIELGAATDTTISRDAAGSIAVEGSKVLRVGKATMNFPATAFIPRTTNGCAPGSAETATNKIQIRSCDYDTTTQEFAQVAFRPPKAWNASTITFQVEWSHAATVTNFGVAFALACVVQSDDDTQEVALGTAVQVTDTGGTTDDMYITAESSAVTIAGTPAKGDWLVCDLKRVPADAGDTLAVDARIQGLDLYLTTDAANDT